MGTKWNMNPKVGQEWEQSVMFPLCSHSFPTLWFLFPLCSRSFPTSSRFLFPPVPTLFLFFCRFRVLVPTLFSFFCHFWVLALVPILVGTRTQKLEKNGNKVGTRTQKWQKNGNKVGTRTRKWEKHRNKVGIRTQK